MASVLVIGGAVLDFVFNTETMPVRAEKHQAREFAVVGGGIAANAAVAIARLGGTARLITRLGDDPAGATIRTDLEAEGVDLSASVITPGGRSAVSAVVIDARGERMIVNFPGHGLAQTAAIPQTFDAVLADTRWPKAALHGLQAARANGKPGVLDAESPVPEKLVQAASHTVFSAQGLRAFTGHTTLEEGLAAIDTNGWVAVTDGARGLGVRQDGTVQWIAGYRIDAVDTLGAGDVWHGAFALALAEGQSKERAARFGHAAAALKCAAFGGRAGAPNRDRVVHFMETEQ